MIMTQKHSDMSFLHLQGAKSGEYKQLLERRRVISKQLQQKQPGENRESICS